MGHIWDIYGKYTMIIWWFSMIYAKYPIVLSSNMAGKSLITGGYLWKMSSCFVVLVQIWSLKHTNGEMFDQYIHNGISLKTNPSGFLNWIPIEYSPRWCFFLFWCHEACRFAMLERVNLSKDWCRMVRDVAGWSAVFPTSCVLSVMSAPFFDHFWSGFDLFWSGFGLFWSVLVSIWKLGLVSLSTIFAREALPCSLGVIIVISYTINMTKRDGWCRPLPSHILYEILRIDHPVMEIVLPPCEIRQHFPRSSADVVGVPEHQQVGSLTWEPGGRRPKFGPFLGFWDG